MEDESRVGKQLVVRRQGADVALVERDVRIALVVRQVRRAPADQVVNNADAETPLDQQIHHVAADEPGPARNNCKKTTVH